MTVSDLLSLLFPRGRRTRPTAAQRAIIRHKQGPGWVFGGPGCGKTEALAVLVLRLLYVEDNAARTHRVRPEQILVTTFAEKAARNLRERISRYHAIVVSKRPELATIDISKLRLGTLPGVCKGLLQEFDANYQNIRVTDKFEDTVFVYNYIGTVDDRSTAIVKPLSKLFSQLFSPPDWRLSKTHLPSRWNIAVALVELFDRMTDDRVSFEQLRAAGSEWTRLADLHQQYRATLHTEHQSDSSHLQKRFLDFLRTPAGSRFRDSGEDGELASIKWVLVDDYQDASPIQEEICLTLASRPPSNIVVFGDDDQALYRSGGRSGECLATFDQACDVYLGLPSATVARYPLITNFTSHAAVVSFCNDYVTAFTSMAMPGARVPNKPLVVSRSTGVGDYPAVGQLRAGSMIDLAHRFAQTVRDLKTHGIIQDYNECCLLLRSAKETPNNAKKYASALRAKGIPVYNPRNRPFLEQEEIRGLLGALISTTDATGHHEPSRPSELVDLVQKCRATYLGLAAAHPQLAQYVTNTNAIIARHAGAFLTANLPGLVDHLLSLPPFDGWGRDPARRWRLDLLASLVDSFLSTSGLRLRNDPRQRPVSSRDSLRDVPAQWSYAFYHLFLGYLFCVDLDEEDDDQATPSGMFPILPMHHAKGLKFPLVFVGHVGEGANISIAHQLETQLAAFPTNSARTFARLPENVRAELGLIRQYYVAYTTAQRAIILMGTDEQFARGRIPCGPNSTWFKSRVAAGEAALVIPNVASQSVGQVTLTRFGRDDRGCE